MSPTYQPGLHRFAVLTVACTGFLLVAGALVTSNEVGLAVPDWPLSYGTLMPPMVGGVFFEHGHRLVAGVVLILTLTLAIWLARSDSRPRVRAFGWFALAAVLAQAVLGGVTVLLELPRGVSMAHATLAQLFFCAVVGIALFTSRRWITEIAESEESEASPLRNLATITCVAIFFQLILGAGFRHGAFGILPHLIGAAVVATLAYRTAAVTRMHYPDTPMDQPARILGWLITGQLILGGASLWARMAIGRPEPLLVVLTVAHVALGAVTFATAVVVTLWARRILRRAGEYVYESKPGRATA